MPSFKKGSRNVIHSDAKRFRKRKRFNKRSVIKKPGRFATYGAAATQARNDVGMLMRFLNVEDKRIDNTAVATAFTAAWQIACINGCGTGSSATTRNGQSIKLVGLEGAMTFEIAAATPACSVRIAVVYDKSPNAVIATGLNIFESASVLSPRNPGTISRFSMLYENRLCLDTLGPGIQIDNFQIEMNQHVSFNTGGAGTIADIQEGAIYILWISDTATNFPTWDYYFRVAFVDN